MADKIIVESCKVNFALVQIASKMTKKDTGTQVNNNIFIK